MLRKFTTQIAAILLVAFPSLALSEESNGHDPRQWGLNPDAITAISIVIDDQANGACWTNLRESRVYAEEKLAIKGYNVVEEVYPILTYFRFLITVVAFRLPNGLCAGRIDVSVSSAAIIEEDGKEFFGKITLHDVGSVNTNPENLNRKVIEKIGEIIADM